MDPERCLQWAQKALDEGRLDDAADHLFDYHDWRRLGGFEPPSGDARRDTIMDAVCKRRSSRRFEWYREAIVAWLQLLPHTTANLSILSAIAKKLGFEEQPPEDWKPLDGRHTRAPFTGNCLCGEPWSADDNTCTTKVR